eukprot:366175-Chlamydomonas_euryale.AAC.14
MGTLKELLTVGAAVFFLEDSFGVCEGDVWQAGGVWGGAMCDKHLVWRVDVWQAVGVDRGCVASS